MDRPSEKAAKGFGLLANGSSRLWAVDIDESDCGDEWSMQLDGPQVYLAFQLRDLGVVSEVIRLLQAPPYGAARSDRQTSTEPNEAVTLGKFGTAPVSLVWDDEDFPRCFVIVGPDARSALRLSLGPEDIEMLLQAFQQVAEDLPHGGSGNGA